MPDHSSPEHQRAVIRRPLRMGRFEFVAIAALRAAQLSRGCRPKVDGDHTTAVLAQLEVAEGEVRRTAPDTACLVPDLHEEAQPVS